MRCAVSFACLALLVASAASARQPVHTRSYLTFGGGAHILTGDTSGPVIAGRGEGMGELGVGYQLSERWLLEGTYGFLGRWELPRYVPLDPGEPAPPDYLHVFRVSTNSLGLRAHWVRGGARTEYFKPDLSIGAGFVQVTRLLRNYPAVPPFDTSHLLATAEVGAAGLFVFSHTFMASVGARYRVTERRDIADATRHLDGVSISITFRAFLPSPRDVEEPEEQPQSPNERRHGLRMSASDSF